MRLHRNETAALAIAFGLGACLIAGDAGADAALLLALAPEEAPQKPLSASLTGMAKAEYEAGRVLYGDKDYAAALIKFQRAHELSSDPRLLWNVAVCQKNLRRYAAMLATLEALLEDGGAALTPQDRKDATELVKTARTFVSPLKLTVSEAGATVQVDGEEVGKTPLDRPVLLDVGSRRIRISKAGFKDVERTEQISGGADLELRVKLERDLRRGRVVVVAGPEDLISIDGRLVG